MEIPNRYSLANLNYSPEAKVAIKTALSAGRAVRRHIGGKVEVKGGISNVVTAADKASGVAIRGVIHDFFPQDPILSEDPPLNQPEIDDPLALRRLWVADEADGSKNLADGIDNVEISIAFLENGEPIVGVAYNPINGKMYFGQKNQGAYYFGPKYGGRKWIQDRIFVSNQTDLSKATIETSMSYQLAQTINHQLVLLALFTQGITPRPRQIGSSVEQLCRVAHGISDAEFHFGLEPWDYAAGLIILREANGDIEYPNSDKEFNILSRAGIAGNPIIRGKLIEVIQQIPHSEELIAKLAKGVREFKIP